MEFVCVDNNSSDASPAILAEFGPRIRVIQERRPGAGAARNAGLRAAKARWIAFTDADCVVDPHWLENLLPQLESGVADGVGGRILALPGANAIERFGETIHDHCHAIEESRLPYLITMNMGISLALIRRHGGFDERWMRSQDSELSIRLVEAGCRFAYAPSAVIRHHNEKTLIALWREGYTHGYWGAELHRAYCGINPMNRQASETAASEKAAPNLTRWQRAVCANVFQSGKRWGFVAGKRFPPAILKSQPVLLRDEEASA
jgi:GT2 family glycosyltransferase